MKLLVDTQVLLWMSQGKKKFNPEALAVLTATGTSRLFSAASVWEMAIKWRLGKLLLPDHPRSWTSRMMRELVLEALPMRHDHAIRAADLPSHHNDPFDRILIAQAQIEGVAVVTADRMFSKYDIDIIAAG